MFENKPVKSSTIWISLLTSLSYLVTIGGVVNASPLRTQNSQQKIARQIATIKQTETESDTEKPVTEEADDEAEAEVDNTLEKAIIGELNRVRTNPQGYADWLENQKQYYQGMLLKLPGEQPIRTNRGLRSLEEAIAFLRQQQELPALSSSTKLTTAARQQITAITNNQQANRHNLVYGKVTPEAIVMQLVVDDGFPDRPHRLAIFNRNHQNTGIACSEIPVYNNVCAIAYREKGEVARQVEANTEETTQSDRLPTPPETEATSEEVIVTTKPASETDILEINPSPSENNLDSETEVVENNTPETEATESEITPPSDTDSETEAIESEINSSPSENNLDSETEVVENNTPETEAIESEITPPSDTDSETEVVENNTPETEATESEITPPSDTDSETEAIATTEETNSNVATSNTNTPSQAVEILERGTLEEGDDVIPNDGSFYDSYPLEGSAGDSFIITLESEDFDTFLAIMDRDGNIIEQNDDADEQQSNSRLEITLPDDGTYSIIVNAYEEQGEGNYVLTVRR